MNNIDYVKEISIAMDFYNLSHRDVCRRAGLYPQYIAQIMSGKTAIPKFDCLISIAKVYDMERIYHEDTTEKIRSKIGNNIILDIIDLLDNRTIFDTNVI